MRYDTPVYFVSESAPVYDAFTGDYKTGAPSEVVRYASVMDTRRETLQLVYGAIRQGSLTVQLQAHYLEPFDWLIVAGRRYRVDFERKLRNKHVFVVSEVQHGKA